MISLFDFNISKEVRNKVDNDFLNLFNELIKKSISVFKARVKIKLNVI